MRESGSRSGGRSPISGMPSSSTSTTWKGVGEYHIFGHYLTPHGFGRLVIEKGVRRRAVLRCRDGRLSDSRAMASGFKLDRLEMAKGTGS